MSEAKFTAAFSVVKQLAADFEANEQTYLEQKYSESQARLDFIDKFWIALDWDVNHEREKNPYQQEVKVERGVKVSNRLKKADYAFFAAPNFRDVKFYVEAKKPSRNLDNADDYFQTIRYGWSSNTPLAVLTDFEQLRIIDCRYKPNIKTAENFALKKFSYREYADEAKFREIYHLFSREAVIAGALEDYANSLPKRGRGAKQGRLFATGIQKSVDESFLDDLDGFREQFARAFKNKNPELDGEDLTEAVTRTIDRLVFIRFLEDKLIESETMMDKFDSWSDFVKTTARLNSVYNGIVFKPHFIDSPDFKPDDRVFAEICGELSDKNTPYYFGNIPAHILGSVYERFLGKVIIATDKRATVEEKPEVRKAGGVYYTPEYIVRYIVENTVGKLIEGKTPEEIAQMRFADIACGSGSFLLGVYDSLLRWHTTYYNQVFDKPTPTENRQREAKKAGCIVNSDGSFTLSIAQRREILRNNVFGVDVDAQATEVAQLSLALKLLEDATTATARAFQPKLGEKILPDMTKNIVCGNSLIDRDILDGQLFERNDERKLNPMSYEDKFPQIMRDGGFDAIVGNPPYVRPHNIPAQTKQILWSKYSTFVAKSDLYSVFMERSLSLVKFNGLVSFIVPQTWTSLESFTKIRHYILRNAFVNKLVQLPKKVFSDATVETCVFIINRVAEELDKRANIIQIDKIDFDKISFEREFYQAEIEDAYIYNFQLYGKNNSKQLIEKIKQNGQSLGQFVKFVYGFKTGDDEKFIHTTPLHNESKLFIRSADVARYSHSKPTEYVWYVPEKMTKHRKTARPGDLKRFEANKIIVARMVKQVVATYDSNRLFVKDAMLLIDNHTKHSMLYLLAVINSRLINYFYKEFFVTIDVLKNALLSLPIHTINFDDAAEKVAHDKMVGLVEQMLDAKKHLQAARTDRDKTFYEDKCRNLDRQIDKLVYELYALTPDEIKIVENQ